MTNMKRRTALAATASVWLVAAASAGALTYNLNRPLRPVLETSEVAPPADPDPSVRADPAFELPPVPLLDLSVPAAVRPIPHRPMAATGARPATEISQMHCADWRELNMGSGHVQVCE